MLTEGQATGLILGSIGALSIVVALAWWRHAPRLRRAIAVAIVLFVAAPVVGRIALNASPAGASVSPPASMNLMHEDTTLGVLDRITQPWTWQTPARWLLGPGHGLAGRAAANRLLHGLAMLTLGILLYGMLDSWVAALWIVALGMLSGLPLVIASSETWTPVIWLVCGLGGIGVGSANQASLSTAARWCGAALVLGLGALLGPRHELWLLWLAGSAAALWPLVLTKPTRTRLQQVAARILRRPARAPVAALVAVGGLVVGQAVWGEGLTQAVVEAFHAQTGRSLPHLWVSAALAGLPTDLSFLVLPAPLSAATPVAFVGLTLAGAWHVVRRDRRWLWLLLATLTVFKIYWAAGHGHAYESQRYLANLLPALTVLAALGWRQMRPLLAQPLSLPSRRRGLVTLVALLSLIDGRYANDMVPWSAWPFGVALERNFQVNANFLASTTQRWPTCVLVSRSAEHVSGEYSVDNEALVVWGAGWPARRVDGDDTALAAALDGLVPRPNCALAVTALACHLEGSRGCDGLGEGEVLDQVPQLNAPYRHAHFGVARGAVLRFEVRPLARRWWPGVQR